MEKLIQIKNLTKCFGETKVLDKINVNFDRGHIYGIIGRNGSGKSMLMKCICGLVVPTSGEIIIDNKKLGTDIDLPENLAGIIEEPGFLENYSAYKKLHVGKYSMGMKQRLGIAQAIMEKPEILILDEPMNGLDNDGVMEMRKLFINLREEGTMIIIASHNKEDIEVLCDEVFEMEKGKLTPVQH